MFLCLAKVSGNTHTQTFNHVAYLLLADSSLRLFILCLHHFSFSPPSSSFSNTYMIPCSGLKGLIAHLCFIYLFFLFCSFLEELFLGIKCLVARRLCACPCWHSHSRKDKHSV